MAEIDVRVLADDLTGALDSAVAFGAPGKGIGVSWHRETPPRARLAVDLATREGPLAEAVARHAHFAPWLRGGDISFKKIDSLLRGHVAGEILASAREQAYDRIVVAPAFPFQGRVTVGGRQRRAGQAEPIGPDLAAELGGANGGRGVTVYDAATDADLDGIVAAAFAAGGRILWVGTGGLAAAIARRIGAGPRESPHLPAPFLGLVGTDHEITGRQTAQFAAAFPDGSFTLGGEIGPVRQRLAARIEAGLPSLATVLASGSRQAAALQIGRALADLVDGLPRPGTLLVTGGETLRSVCDALGASQLLVENEVEPGVPVCRIIGGVYDGQVLLGKSGAFGAPELFRRLAGDQA